jgi:GNAT superfamily N-acetyltransferase
MRYGERKSAMRACGWPSRAPSLPQCAARLSSCDPCDTAPAHRRQGHASRLLEQVTAEADRGGFFLFLAVEPEGEISAIELAQFYRRHGFLPIQPEPLLMVRPNVGSGMQAPPVPTEKAPEHGAI